MVLRSRELSKLICYYDQGQQYRLIYFDWFLNTILDCRECLLATHTHTHERTHTHTYTQKL